MREKIIPFLRSRRGKLKKEIDGRIAKRGIFRRRCGFEFVVGFG